MDKAASTLIAPVSWPCAASDRQISKRLQSTSDRAGLLTVRGIWPSGLQTPAIHLWSRRSPDRARKTTVRSPNAPQSTSDRAGLQTVRGIWPSGLQTPHNPLSGVLRSIISLGQETFANAVSLSQRFFASGSEWRTGCHPDTLTGTGRQWRIFLFQHLDSSPAAQNDGQVVILIPLRVQAASEGSFFSST